MKNKSFLNWEELKVHLRGHQPTLYCSSQTSCVIPFDRPESFHGDEVIKGELAHLPAKAILRENQGEISLWVEGPLSWKEARAYCRSRGRDIKSCPTEDLAAVTAGVSTSATGERSFGLGSVRDHILSLTFLDRDGEEMGLSSRRLLSDLPRLSSIANTKILFDNYARTFAPYRQFKNGPFPRLERETDLMVGTEGQLGVVSAVELETIPLGKHHYFFLQLPRWEENYVPHLEIFAKVNGLRGKVLSCELADAQSLARLKEHEHFPGGDRGGDVIFLEVAAENLEEVDHHLLSNLMNVPHDRIFELPENKFHDIRRSIPRTIQEENSRLGVSKRGTDVQVPPNRFKDLLDYYREGARLGIPSILFGHFGDAHLHFNFMVNQDPGQTKKVEMYLDLLYKKTHGWHGSPFAEHGVGLLKQRYIAPFYQGPQKELFAELKRLLDPQNQFFPQGFMSMSI